MTSHSSYSTADVCSPSLKDRETFLLIWLNTNVESPHYNTKSIFKLCYIVDNLEPFETIDTCIDYITDCKDKIIFFIISGSVDGERLVSLVNEIPQINSIYLFLNEANYKQGHNYEKLRGVFNDIDTLCDKLKNDVLQCSSDLLSISSISLSKMSGSNHASNLNKQETVFMYSILIRDVLVGMERTSSSIEEMIAFFRQRYKENNVGLALIDEFEKDYSPDKVIWWYTRNCFIYENLNAAVRTLDIGTLYKMRSFVKDLHQQLKSCELSPTITTVYRGQALRSEEFARHINNIGGLLSINNFLSTSTNREVALGFAFANLDRPGYESILFEIEIDQLVPEISVANIEHLSYFQAENEVLFSMCSVFRIKSVVKMNNGIWNVALTLTGDEDNQLQTLTKYMKKIIGHTANLSNLARLMIEMDEFYYAEQFFQTFFDDSSSIYNLHDLNNAYNCLGFMCYKRGDNAKALDYYKKVLDSEQYMSNERSLLAATYNNIGEIYRIKEDSDQAIQNYTKAIEMGYDDPELLEACYNNIGLIHAVQHNYSAALEMFERALEIAQINYPLHHPSLARLYSNISTIYRAQGNATIGIEMLEKALEIKNSSLPPTHLDLALANRLLGLALHSENRISESAKYLQKSHEIHLKSFLKPDNHQTPAIRCSNYGAILHAEGKHEQALQEYEKALAIELIDHSPNDPSLEPIYYAMGTIHLKEENYSQALEMFEKIVEIQTGTMEVPNKESLVEAYTLISTVYTGQKKNEKAFNFMVKALEIASTYLPADHRDIQLYHQLIEVICQNLK